MGPYGLAWWQWLALPIFAAAALAVGRVLGAVTHGVLQRVLRRTFTHLGRALAGARGAGADRALGDGALPPRAAVARVAPSAAQRVAASVTTAVSVVAVFWAVWRSVDVAVEVLVERTSSAHAWARVDAQQRRQPAEGVRGGSRQRLDGRRLRLPGRDRARRPRHRRHRRRVRRAEDGREPVRLDRARRRSAAARRRHGEGRRDRGAGRDDRRPLDAVPHRRPHAGDDPQRPAGRFAHRVARLARPAAHDHHGDARLRHHRVAGAHRGRGRRIAAATPPAGLARRRRRPAREPQRDVDRHRGHVLVPDRRFRGVPQRPPGSAARHHRRGRAIRRRDSRRRRPHRLTPPAAP